jgi:hypothetical protein
VKLLTFEDGIVRLGGDALPGLLASLSVDGEVRYDEQKVDGQSGKRKTPKGFEDQEVSVTLTLCTDEQSDCYEKLAQLMPFFRKTTAQANPQIYDFVNRHAGARGIRRVIFDKLKSAETNTTDTITATLSFREHRPPIVRKEAAAAKTPKPGEVGKEAGNKEPEEDKLAINAGDGK